MEVILGWEDKPMDLDLHVMGRVCHVYYMRKNCVTHMLDVDNRKGGQNGFETITFTDIDSHRNNKYLVFIDDFSREPEQFLHSGAVVRITDSVKITKAKLYDNQKPKKYWIAGCLQILGTQTRGRQTYVWEPIQTFVPRQPRLSVCDYPEDIRTHVEFDDYSE